MQLVGGPVVASPFNQILIPTQVGYQKFNPYPTPGDQGDPAGQDRGEALQRGPGRLRDGC